jgi:hypothetical protein
LISNSNKNHCKKEINKGKFFPTDIHHFAQGILTFSCLNKIDNSGIHFAHVITAWTLGNMYSSQGYFNFRKGRSFVNRIDYIRWAQAWMLLALSEIL